MLCSNVVIKIILSTIEKLGNVRNAPNLLYVVIYIEKNTKNLFILVFLLAAVIVRFLCMVLYNLKTRVCVCHYDA